LFAATVKGSANQEIVWSVQEASTGGSITTSGLYTAPSSAGTFHVVATSVADSSQHAVATVSVGQQSSSSSYLGSPLCLTPDSKVVDRAGERLAERDGLQHPTPPGSGTVSSSYNSAGLLSSWDYSSSSVSMNESFNYDSSGHLVSWQQSWSDSTPTIYESFTYDSRGLLTAWQQSWSSSTPTVHESFTYDSGGNLTHASCTGCTGAATVVCTQ